MAATSNAYAGQRHHQAQVRDSTVCARHEMEAFVRRAADGTVEADLFEKDGIPPKDPPRVRGQPSAYVAVLAFSNSAEHAELWEAAIPPVELIALMEQLRRKARTPPPPSAQIPGSASHLAIDVDHADEPGGTAPLGAAGQAIAAPAEDDEAEEPELGQAASSAARDPAVQPARREGTRPPTQLDEQDWDAYMYKTSGSNTFYGAWGFDGKPARHDQGHRKKECRCQFDDHACPYPHLSSRASGRQPH